ncbi:hypothetical protein R3X27_21960 [Tropicimonas sp. TH_r6]|uniref:hypothetical protein n=1 Tax=Tropicimonas sp. TH_r6 TaxID=3082085 RepID=UPI0029558CDA|nr:hypothetical protein [Tropicimonas sp. TH_r6]MDV7145359.1 hypothetical protein [Tropicimonas sp. TH_r6]
MALKRTIAKLNDYQDRLKDKKAKQIKVKHVDKIISKLEAKKADLDKEFHEATKPSRKERLKRKRKVLRDQIEQAEFLRKEILKSQK